MLWCGLCVTQSLKAINTRSHIIHHKMAAGTPVYEEEEEVDSTSKYRMPALIDATSDELLSGLQRGSFTSLDLVNVSPFFSKHITILILL